MSRRQQIVDAVKARFAAVTAANGYQSNVGQKVFEWQTSALDPEDLPCTLLADPVEETPEPGNINSGQYERRLQFVAALALAGADATAAKAREAIEDVTKAIGTDPRWGGLVNHTLPISDEVVVDEDGQRIVGARVTFEAVYSRKPWAP